jgi:hypothetical protein
MTGPVSDRSSDRRLVIVGTTGERITGVRVAVRAVHRAVLQAFAATGAPPERPDLIQAAGGADLDLLLAELHEHDVIRLEEGGAIRVAYPFSTRPTAHVVDIDGGPSVYAMCAVDALGMSAMLHGSHYPLHRARDRDADQRHRPQQTLDLVAAHHGRGRRQDAQRQRVRPARRSRCGRRRPEPSRRCGGYWMLGDELLHPPRPCRRLAGRPPRGYRRGAVAPAGAAPGCQPVRPPLGLVTGVAARQTRPGDNLGLSSVVSTT